MKRIAICDDSRLQREILAEMLKEYFRKIHQDVELVEYSAGETLADDMEDDDLHVELIFLDIYMGGMNGIDTAKRLRKLGCSAEIVFLTASSEHAIESYDVHASGYLVKPIGIDRLTVLLDHILGIGLRRRIEIKTGRQYRYPYVSDIMYIEGTGHRASIYLVDGSQITTTEKVSTLSAMINSSLFVQCHQSYLVNMNYISDIDKDIILSNGVCIPVSIRRRTDTIETYHQFFNQNLS